MKTIRNDISDRQAIELLVNSFYAQVKNDGLIGPIFNKIVHVNWDHHLPKMYDFFETIILGEKGFKGNPMEVHFKLNRQFPLLAEHFNQWKLLFLLLWIHISADRMPKQPNRKLLPLPI